MSSPATPTPPGPPCPVCGQTVTGAAPGSGEVRRCPNRWCRRPDRGFSVAFSVGLHQGGLRWAITRYKYRGDRALAAVFAGAVASYLDGHRSWFEEFDLLTAVPTYLGPGARRSWDPVGTILSALAARLGDSWAVSSRAVTKVRETPGMAGRSWAERQDLARGPLRASLAVPDPELVAGRQVLVLDDVLTEGSTLREVARALRRAGASDVAGLVLARPPWAPVPPGRAEPAVPGSGAAAR